MQFQIDISADVRTPEQNALLERYYQAVKILKAAGFRARVSLNIITKSTDNPADIILE